MRCGHRRTHRLVWLILMPLILIGLTMALALRKPPAPAPHETAQETNR